MASIRYGKGGRAALLGTVVAGLVAACGGSGGPSSPSSASPSGPQEVRAVLVNAQAATVGSISVRATYLATVVATDQANISPIAAGQVDRVMVELGSEVQKGQVLAEMVRGTLDAQLAQAESGVRQAQGRLNSSKASLAVARAQLDDLLHPAPADLQAATSAVATAQANLDAAATRLAQLLKPSATDLQAAASAVATAQANLDTAKTRLAQLLKPLATDIQAAATAVATAQANLDSAKSRLDQLLNPLPADLAAARAAVASAQSTWRAAQATFDSTVTTTLRAPLTAEGQSALRSLQAARKDLTARQDALDALEQAANPNPNDLADARQRLAASQATFAGFLGDVLRTVDGASSLRSAYAAEQSAQSALDSAKARLAALLNPDAGTIAQTRNAVTSAQAALDAAKAKQSDLLSPDPNTVALTDNAVKIAQAALDAAKAKQSDLLSPDPNTVAAANNAAKAAQAALDSAQAKLAVLTNPGRSQLAAAQAAVATAEETVTINQAALDQAQAQVDLVKTQIAQTRLLAPFDGVVTQRFLAAGAIANAATPVVAVASKTVLLTLNVEETGVAALAKGQTVTVSSPALPGKSLELPIAAIAPAGDPQAHTFQVQIKADAASGLRPGLSADVTINTGRQNVVLVPKEAILARDGQPSAFVIEGGLSRLRKVTAGLSDGRRTEVVSGVRSGEQVILSPAPSMADNDPVTVRPPAQQAGQPAQGGPPAGPGGR